MKKPRPLSQDGSLSLAYVSDDPRLVYIKPKNGKYICENQWVYQEHVKFVLIDFSDKNLFK